MILFRDCKDVPTQLVRRSLCFLTGVMPRIVNGCSERSIAEHFFKNKKNLRDKENIIERDEEFSPL